MPNIAVKDLTGQDIESITLSDEVFGAPVNGPLMHQAATRLMSDRRAGTQQAKTRGEVSGSTAKPWRQKGTGRARAGMRKSPLWRGGGIVFAPHPRSYETKMPKKMRRQATRSALSSRLVDQGLVVVSSLVPPERKTKAMVAALGSLNASGKVLLVDHQISEDTQLSARNIPELELKPASTVNIVDVLNHDTLVFTVEGIRELERLLSDGNA
jgi:large subunit ribosomal protein L4